MRSMTSFQHGLALWTLCFIPTCLLHAAEPSPTSQSMLLWYRQPATAWLQAMPLATA